MYRCARARLWLAVCLLLGLPGSTALAQERLPSVRVSGKTPCEVHPESASETAELWLAAREALEGSRRLGDSLPRLLVQEWRRGLGRSLRPLWERRDTSYVTTLHPFEKPMPA